MPNEIQPGHPPVWRISPASDSSSTKRCGLAPVPLSNLSAIGIVGTVRSGELSHFPTPTGELRPDDRRKSQSRDRSKAQIRSRHRWEYTTGPGKAARKAGDIAGVP